jgi:hypothetical protein
LYVFALNKVILTDCFQLYKKKNIFVPHKIKCNENIKFKPTMLLLILVASSFLILKLWGMKVNKAAVMALPKPMQVLQPY